MRGTTHAFVGLGSLALIDLFCKLVVSPFLVLGSILGALIPDIDISGSTMSKLAGKIIAIFTAIVILYIFIFSNSFFKLVGAAPVNYKLFRTGIAIIVISAIISRITGHRNFSHSLLGMAAFSVGIFMVYPPILKGFIIGYLSHLVIDLLNFKGELLLCPYPAKFSFKICRSDSLSANFCISVISAISFAIYYLK